MAYIQRHRVCQNSQRGRLAQGENRRIRLGEHSYILWSVGNGFRFLKTCGRELFNANVSAIRTFVPANPCRASDRRILFLAALGAFGVRMDRRKLWFVRAVSPLDQLISDVFWIVLQFDDVHTISIRISAFPPTPDDRRTAESVC